MTDATRELKVRAEILHRRITARESKALRRLRSLPPFRRASDEDLLAAAPGIRRHDCLAVVAAELGFPSWPQAKRVLTGEGPSEEFGTLLSPPRCSGHLNRWYVSYDEAATDRQASRGYLLAYRRHYFVVDRYYIETLGLDPDDPDWEEMGFDWARPSSGAARARLYAQLVAGLPRDDE
jgi:hypothetical protein